MITSNPLPTNVRIGAQNANRQQILAITNTCRLIGSNSCTGEYRGYYTTVRSGIEKASDPRSADGPHLIDALLRPRNTMRLSVSEPIEITKIVGFIDSEVPQTHAPIGCEPPTSLWPRQPFNDVVPVPLDGHRTISGCSHLDLLLRDFNNPFTKPSTEHLAPKPTERLILPPRYGDKGGDETSDWNTLYGLEK